MWLSPTKAVKMYNVSKPTLYADMKDGSLSYKMNDRKKRKINVAELDRLYDKRDSEEGASSSKTVKGNSSLTETNVSKRKLEQKLEQAHAKIAESQEREITALKNQIENQKEQIELLNKNLNKALDVTALLEDKREGQGAKEVERDTKLEILENQISRLTAKSERQAAIDKKRIQELEKENAKSWFQKLIGG